MSSLAADPAGKDPLKDAGLSKSGSVYVLPDEAPVLDELKALRVTKVQADKETKSRTVLDSMIAAKRKTINDDDKEWHRLEARLTAVTDPSIHNNIVIRMNRLLAEMKSSDVAAKDLEEQAGKVSTAGKIKFVDDLASLNEKATAVTEKYQALADDAWVKSAIAKANALASTKAALGPTPEFTAALVELKKWQAGVESEAITMREESGIHMVDVLLNGEHFMMGVDTGATAISLPGEVAEKLQMAPGEQDPTVQLTLANGSVIEGKEMVIKSVRVGRFTIEDVRCVVLQKGLPNAPIILGGSFLNHFIVNMDPGKNELRLTEIKEGNQTKGATTKGSSSAGG